MYKVAHATGAILTKMDGDSRGGAALSVKAISGKPIKFVGTGEKLEALEPFYPDRIASRILGDAPYAPVFSRSHVHASDVLFTTSDMPPFASAMFSLGASRMWWMQSTACTCPPGGS